MENKLFIITGPSGVGKTTVAKELLKQLTDLKKIITYTTRKPRPGEKNDLDYHFITENEFQNKLKQGDFFEHAKVYNDFYGNSLAELQAIWNQNQTALMILDIQGADKIKAIIPQSQVIFLMPENLEQIKQRLEERKMSPTDLEKRFAIAQEEMQRASDYDFPIINHQGALAQTVAKIIKIIA